jgi:apolipoprotein N-acyltransferase
LIPALFFTLTVLFARYALRKSVSWFSVFAFPAAWCAYEFLVSRISPHGTFGSQAYSQMDFLPLIQIASIAGITGVTFVLTLVPSGIAASWHLRKRGRAGLLALTIALGAGVLSIAYGLVRMEAYKPGPSVRVGLAATDETIRYFDTKDAREALPVLTAYARRAGDLAARGAQREGLQWYARRSKVS